MILQALTIHTIAKHAQKVFWKQIDDEAILLNLDNGYYYTLNSVAVDIWKLLDGTHTAKNIAIALCEIYDVTEEQIEKDILSLLHECQVEGLITIEDTNKTE